MGDIFLRRSRTALIAATIAASPGLSAADGSVSGDRGTDMALDLLLVRPLGLVGTAIGAAAFVVALPFTVPSGSVRDSACELVQRPAEYTFTRPLGDFAECGDASCDPCAARNDKPGPAQ